MNNNGRPKYSLLDTHFIHDNLPKERRCNLQMKLEKLKAAGIIKNGITDVVAEHDDEKCGLFHGLEICTCDPEIYNMKDERIG